MIEQVTLALHTMGWTYAVPFIILWLIAASMCINISGDVTWLQGLKILTVGGIAVVPVANMVIVCFLLVYYVMGIISSHGNSRN